MPIVAGDGDGGLGALIRLASDGLYGAGCLRVMTAVLRSSSSQQKICPRSLGTARCDGSDTRTLITH